MYISVQLCTTLCIMVNQCTVYLPLQRSTAVYSRVKNCTLVYSSVQQCTVVYSVLYDLSHHLAEQGSVYTKDMLGRVTFHHSLNSTVQCYGVVMLCCVHSSALFSTVQHCTVQHCTALYSIVQNCSIQAVCSTITDRGVDDLPRLPRPRPPPPFPSPSSLFPASFRDIFNCRHP